MIYFTNNDIISEKRRISWCTVRNNAQIFLKPLDMRWIYKIIRCVPNRILVWDEFKCILGYFGSTDLISGSTLFYTEGGGPGDPYGGISRVTLQWPLRLSSYFMTLFLSTFVTSHWGNFENLKNWKNVFPPFRHQRVPPLKKKNWKFEKSKKCFSTVLTKLFFSNLL